MVSPRGPSHRTKRSGSVCALKTSSGGTSNSLVMKSSCLPGSAVILVLLFDMVFLLSFDSGRDCLVATAAWIHPAASQPIAILAKPTLVIRRGAPFPTPDRECIAFDLIHVVERHAIQKTKEAGLDIPAWL